MPTHPYPLIGFVGPAGAGKSTAVAALTRKHGFVRHAFAAPLKRMLAVLMRERGATEFEIRAYLDGPKKQEPTRFLNGATPRLAMQLLGTEWGRALSETLWLDAWRESLPQAPVACDDVRFPNEAAVLRALGGRVVRIDRPSLKINAGVAAHASERHEIEADVTIVNGGWGEFLAAVGSVAD